MQTEDQDYSEPAADGGRYTWSFPVRHYELSPFGLAKPEAYLNWLQEAGILASADNGFPIERYVSMGAFWWVHRFRLEWYDEVEYPALLDATTWISHFRRIRALREYEIRQHEDQRLVCAAQADWAFVNTVTGHPTRVPDEMLTSFPPTGIEALGSVPWSWDGSTSQREPFTSQRMVQYHELDTMGHANHACYLVWFLDCLRQSAATLETEVDLKPVRFDMEYLRSAQQGDALLVACRLMDWHRSNGRWQHEIRLEESGQVIARAHSTCRLVTPSDASDPDRCFALLASRS